MKSGRIKHFSVYHLLWGIENWLLVGELGPWVGGWVEGLIPSLTSYIPSSDILLVAFRVSFSFIC